MFALKTRGPERVDGQGMALRVILLLWPLDVHSSAGGNVRCAMVLALSEKRREANARPHQERRGSQRAGALPSDRSHRMVLGEDVQCPQQEDALPLVRMPLPAMRTCTACGEEAQCP
mmetsp:Transcript_9351/g.25191  ORF Transcript_9351/g.25191 Transcript_9351/m.25191 type:complete len:117 (-) Transcript_9351:13-363(-)